VSENSKIEWTEHTFNPWWGCTKISEGCAHCYAAMFANRVGFSNAGSKFRIWGDDARRRMFDGDEHWNAPLRWNAVAEKLGVMHRVFCGSMCDILENREEFIVPRWRVFELITKTPSLLWLLLSKRPENARELLPCAWWEKWPRNVMFGTTIENQARLEERMFHIRALNNRGARIFLSCEPLLSALDWEGYRFAGQRNARLRYVDWVVAGGESGPGARPMHPDWIRKLRDDCTENYTRGLRPIPFLFKQWGEYHPLTRTNGIHESPFGGQHMMHVGKKAAGRVLDGRTWDGVPLLQDGGPQVVPA